MSFDQAPWKLNQQMYKAIMEGRHTDLLENVPVIDEGDVVSMDSAARYLASTGFPLYQPTKSRLVAIMYAYLIPMNFPGQAKFYDLLDDPDLFLGEDMYFKPYSQDKANYDMLIEKLGDFTKWRFEGWAKRTNVYFWLECTNPGITFVSESTDETMKAFIEHTDINLEVLKEILLKEAAMYAAS